MAINFTDSPANGATQVIGGRTYTYNSAKNKWDTTATEVVGPTATVYATVDNLPGSATTGDQAFVSGTNRLYIWNGSGWYNIALINTNPSISGVNSSYDLATDGTATVVSIVASDPEGLPITYSITSDTSGSVATVVQGTGLNTNSWTITPSTSNADAGTFSLTFRASDGINIASAISSFTLQFSIQNSKYTTTLLTSTGANAATNSTFTDASTNAVSFNVSNVYQTSFSPYRHGGYSTYFDGSGDYLQPAGTTIFDISSSTASFTVEAWINPSALPSAGAYNYRFGSIISKGIVYVNFGFTSNGTLRFYTYSGVENYINSAAGVIEAGKWQHVALVSDAGSITLYKDGVSVATGTLVAPASAGIGVAPKIATADTGQAADYINSYVSDLRVVEGTAVYTSNFTPPTERLTAITNTSLLACHLPYIADGSTNGHTLTPNGNVSVKPFTPYDNAVEYSPTVHGGSLCGNANGELTGTLPSALGSGDFTIEGWFYSENFGSNTGVVTIGNHGANGIAILLENTGKFRIDLQTSYSNNSTSNVQLNTWNHFKVIRSSGTITAYLNGVQEQSFSNALNITATNITIGGRGGLSGYQHEGNLADIKVTASAASDTTVPTSVVSSTNALFHLPFIEAGIIDKSQTASNAILAGNTQSSTTQTKYLSSSMYFDGSGDYITMTPSDLFAFRTGDFTIEGWAYITATGDKGLFQQGTSNFPATNTNSVALQITNAAPANSEWAIYAGNAYHESTVNYALNQWYHFAVARASSVTKLYINGTEALSVSDSVDYTGTYFGVGSIYGAANAQCFTGYMSDFRVTKGLARYTANFTPPTAALQG